MEGPSGRRALSNAAAAATISAGLFVLLAVSVLATACRDTSHGSVAAVSAGTFHTCALTTEGGVLCWGANGNGQLGDGTPVKRRTSPVKVAGLAEGVVAVSGGELHTCALTGSGGVKCWGENGNGQLGDGTTTDRSTPVDAVGLNEGVVAISTGTIHTCALTTSGGVKCWGRMLLGPLSVQERALGTGMARDIKTAEQVEDLATGVIAISSGTLHTCALTTSGGVKCWGYNREGQLGDGTKTDSGTPVDVSGLSRGVVSISAGWKHTCAVKSDATVKCWGWNNGGQIGDGTVTDRTTPTAVEGLTEGAKAVSTGRMHTCALTASGAVKCWGFNGVGQLGNGKILPSSAPVDVESLSGGVTSISAGLSHNCAATSTGGLKCWGLGSSGQLGDGTPSTQHRPVPGDVAGLAGR